ncbi:MDIS1-interacting receptor like kinase 2-like [Macadamia integrifolia]|uniref:MDIS1-interacting receptor like kinase 2-like n=1 Tax=Macadamia integrifolia TaxID=60698 RepID=UPI001C4EF979|nr:MDIS1-interacting receptor like kinase 2-like [Macadamia integrifolia]
MKISNGVLLVMKGIKVGNLYVLQESVYMSGIVPVLEKHLQIHHYSHNSPTTPPFLSFLCLIIFLFITSSSSSSDLSSSTEPQALLNWKATLHNYSTAAAVALRSWNLTSSPNTTTTTTTASSSSLPIPCCNWLLNQLEPPVITLDIGDIWMELVFGSILLFLSSMSSDLNCAQEFPILASARISVLLNGGPVGYFGVERGLRQGDPISSMLFIIAEEVLCRGLSKLLANKSSKALSGPRGAITPTHILFVDDVFIFSNASISKLAGEIPMEFGSLSYLFHLNISGNNISGHVLVEMDKFINLELLDLLANSIPSQIGDLVSLQAQLDLSHNSISGPIPPELAKLVMLEILNLSHNRITGSIPFSLEDLGRLLSLDFSYNELVGVVPNNKIFKNASPQAFRNNKGLCGDLQGLLPYNQSRRSKELKKNGHKVVISIIASLIGIIACVDIIQATENFDSKYCIGTGTSANVYKAVLPTSHVVALKKFHPLEGETIVNDESFRNEMRILTEIRHRNIAKLYGCCFHPRCMFLVYEYMEKGTLARILSKQAEAIRFDWLKRVNVIKSVANALSYLHNECIPPIIHLDISSKNILLDLELKARVSDFGIA